MLNCLFSEFYVTVQTQSGYIMLWAAQIQYGVKSNKQTNKQKYWANNLLRQFHCYQHSYKILSCTSNKGFWHVCWSPAEWSYRFFTTETSYRLKAKRLKIDSVLFVCQLLIFNENILNVKRLVKKRVWWATGEDRSPLVPRDTLLRIPSFAKGWNLAGVGSSWPFTK